MTGARSLEEAGAEKEEPDPFRYFPRSSLCMEQDKDGRLARRPRAVAQSPILRTTITLQRLRKRGYQSLSEHYSKVSPLLNEPLSTRTVWQVV